MTKSKAQLTVEIKQSLGWPTINLELEDSHYDFAINKSIEMYQKFAYGRALHKTWILLSAQSGISAYNTTLSPTGISGGASAGPTTGGEVTGIPSNVLEILNTKFSDTIAGNINTLFTAENLLWNMGYLNVWNWLDGSMGLVSYELTMQYLDLIEQMIPSKYWLRYIPQIQTLYIQPTPVQNTLFMAEVVEKLPAKDLYAEYWVYEWARAEAMEALGFIRSKYGSLPGPGGTMSLDGQALLGEARSEKDRLKIDILRQESEPLEFFLG